MAILSIDYGEKRIGLALGEIGGLVQTLEVLKNNKNAVSKIKEICERLAVKEIIIGVPFNSEGRVGYAARKVKRFAKNLKEEIALPVIFVDEVFTSEKALSLAIQSGKKKKDRKYLDSISAAILLQEYLESKVL